MTVVIGLVDKNTGKIYLGADSRTSIHNGMTVDGMITKIFKYSNEICVGVAGDVRTINILNNTDTSVDDIYELSNVFAQILIGGDYSLYRTDKKCVQMRSKLLITINNMLYIMSNSFSYVPIDTYTAIGSGSELALGSLHTTEYLNKNLMPKEISPRERIRLAIAAAEKFDSSVGGPVTILEI